MLCSTLARRACLPFAALAFALAGPAVAGERADAAPPKPAARSAKAAKPAPAIDHSGAARKGTASFYAPMFAGRKMADGTRMDPNEDNAASRTLPLGTKALVTNLETGRSAVVTIQDRGPYVDGRIVDLSPATAEQIGLSKRQGLAEVEVAPIAVPQPDGSVKPGEGASQTADAR